ncbi:hypothetical protein [Streptomyces sp. NPDC006645]|uniref:hypothetical protein n=1 Tax=unclassified Streptomyces TaxID=2593676 RepID=UPI0033B9DF80
MRGNSALAKPNPVDELAQWLGSLRQLSGLSYREMALRATTDPSNPFPHMRFYYADKGRSLPSWQVVLAYVRVCDGEERRAERLWKRARTATAPPDSPGAGAGRRRVLAPSFIREPIELLDAMHEMRFTHGNKPLRVLAEQAGVGRLPRSTLGAVLAGKRMPSKDLFMAFVQVCGNVQPGTRKASLWEGAWTRADATHRGVPADAAPSAPLPPAKEQGSRPLSEVRPWRTRAASLCQGLRSPRSQKGINRPRMP